MYGYNGGPRCSPVVDGERVYIFARKACCIASVPRMVELIWKCDTLRQFGVIQNFFGVGSTPIVEGDLLLTVVGGSPHDDQRRAA